MTQCKNLSLVIRKFFQGTKFFLVQIYKAHPLKKHFKTQKIPPIFQEKIREASVIVKSETLKRFPASIFFVFLKV